MNLRSQCEIAVLAASLCCLQMSALAAAQQPSSTAAKSGIVLVPGTLTGVGSMGPRGARRFCNPRSIGLAEWRAATIARILNLDDLQKSALNELSGHSAKALEMIASVCSKTNKDKTHLAVFETRVETMLQVLRTVRPAYEKFYAMLSDTQKIRLDALGPSRHGWQW